MKVNSVGLFVRKKANTSYLEKCMFLVIRARDRVHPMNIIMVLNGFSIYRNGVFYSTVLPTTNTLLLLCSILMHCPYANVLRALGYF